MADDVKRCLDIGDGETFKYTPLTCVDRKAKVTSEGEKAFEEKDVAATFSGHVVLKKIGLLRRLELAPKLDEIRKDNDPHGLKAAGFAVKETMSLWESVDITHLKSGKKFASLAEMLLDTRCDSTIFEIAFGHIDGFSAANGEHEGN